MTATVEPPVADVGQPSADERHAKLQREFLETASRELTRTSVLRCFASILRRQARSHALLYFQRGEDGQLTETNRFCEPRLQHADRLARKTHILANSACETGELVLRPEGGCWLAAIPIPQREQDPEALGLVFDQDESPQQLTMLVQLVASHLVLWQVLASQRVGDSVSRDTAAIVELVERITSADTLKNACYAAVCELQAHLKCQRAALGLCRSRGPCRLVAISDASQFDHRSPASSGLEAAFDEALLRGDPTFWPASDDQRHAVLAHKGLCTQQGKVTALSIPLITTHGTVVGVLTLLDDSIEALEERQAFLRAASEPLASSLCVVQRLEGGRMLRTTRRALRSLRAWQTYLVIGLMGLALAAMWIPIPYKIKADCRIEPIVRRFVAAPFDGTLERSLVEPGEIVPAGSVLARMDGRELRWKRAGAEADRNQALKQRDAAQAARKYADAQIAQLEMERLALELQVLEHRAEHLEIKSPIAGIVVSGDHKRAEGAPLTQGQTLFEIAPLDHVVVEVAIPDAEMAFASQRQRVQIRLDAYPGANWETSLQRIHPRSEIRNDQNVFIGESPLANQRRRLRPGMKGRAQIITPNRRLGWVLFHKPWEYLTKRLAW